MRRRAKLNLIAIIILVVVVLLVVAYLVFHNGSTNSTIHTVTYKGTTIYSGPTIPCVSSDDVSNILLGTDEGLILFDTNREVARKLNSTIASGLAYDGFGFLCLQPDGTLLSVSLSNGATTEIGTGYSQLYDTTDGFFVSVGGVSSVSGGSGSKVPISGKYKSLRLSIV